MGSTLVRITVILAVSFALSAVSRCQEDYIFGVSRSATETPTPTASATATPSGSPTATPTVTPSESQATPTPSESIANIRSENSDTEESTDQAKGSLFLRGLQDLSDEQSGESEEKAAKKTNDTISEERESERAIVPKPLSLSDLTVTSRTAPENWLGKLYTDEDPEFAALDQDNDGYSDALESDIGSDEFDAESTPGLPTTTLKQRIMKYDADLDGLRMEEELKLGSDPESFDSDGDGFRDGSERRAGTDLLDPDSMPVDRDGDGLGDGYEKRVGISPYHRDTDGDGADDEAETIFGSDPRVPDTDGDGIFDGEEIKQGSDPLIPESNR